MIWADKIVTFKDGSVPEGATGPGTTTWRVRERGTRWYCLVKFPWISGGTVGHWVPFDAMKKVEDKTHA